MVSLIVLAIVIDHVPTLYPVHGLVLLIAKSTRMVGRCRGRAAPSRRVGRATIRLEVGECPYKWLVLIIGLVFSIFGCPWRCIPYWSVNPHWPYWECSRALSRVPPYWNVIHQKSVCKLGILVRLMHTDQVQLEKLYSNLNWPRNYLLSKQSF